MELGKHWVGIYIMKTGNGGYFDSFFKAPKHPDITRLLEKQIKCWIRETKMIQILLIFVYGEYCIVLLIYFNDFKNLHRFINLFSQDFIKKLLMRA